MPASIERQVSFASGELDPALHGRNDLSVYAGGAVTLKNFIVTPHGVAMNRPGTQYLKSIYQDRATNIFVHGSSWGNALLLFESSGWLRIYTAPETSALPTVFSHPYGSYLSSIRVSQVGNRMRVTNLYAAPYELRRTSSTGWSFSPLSFAVTACPAWDARPLLVATAAYVSGDAAHPAREWDIVMTKVMRDSNGMLYETTASPRIEYRKEPGDTVVAHLIVDATDVTGPPAGIVEIAIYPDHTQKIVWGSHAYGGVPWESPTAPSGADEIVATRIYRGRDGMFGFIGETTANHFTDDGAVPDFSNPPPAGVNPFEVYDTNGTLVRTEEPGLSCFHVGRCYLGPTEERPTMIRGSAIENYNNYDEVIPADDSDALSLDVASSKFEQIRALVPAARLMAITSAGAYLLEGTGVGNVLSPASLNAARPISKVGCALNPAPAEAGDTVFYPQSRGAGVWLLRVSDAEGVSQREASVASRHLLRGSTVVDMAFAEWPNAVLWVALSNGDLLSLTYSQEYGVLAWAKHEIAGDGLVESIAVGGDTDEDEDVVYLVVNRDGERTIERFAPRIFTDIRRAVFMDASVSYDGTNDDVDGSGNLVTITLADTYAGAGVIGTDVTVTFSYESSVGSEVGAIIQVDVEDSEPVKLRLHTHNGSSVYRATVLASSAVPSALFGAAKSVFYRCARSVDGLSQTVVTAGAGIALVDGNVVENVVTSGGSATFAAEEDYASYFAIAHVGLQYDCDFESLDAPRDKQRQKIVKRVYLELESARGGLVGTSLEDSADLVEIRTRETGDGYRVLEARRQEVEVPVSGQWGKRGRVAFRQNSPVPVTILGITREVEYGG